jgi:hypothetical protein
MPSKDLSVRDVLRHARAVAADFDGVTIESLAAMDGEAESVELLVSVPKAGERQNVMLRVQRKNQTVFERELREHLTAALKKT